MEYRYRADELVSMRKESHVSQADTARATKISQAVLSRYETGQNVPTLVNAMALADYYGVPYGEFVSRIFDREAEVA